MNRLGQKIYANAFGYDVYGVVTQEKSSTRRSAKLYVVSPNNGEMSEIFTIPRKDVRGKKNCFDFFYDLEGDFTRDDIDSIRNAVLNLLNSGSNVVATQDKATLAQIHQAVSDFIRDNAEELEDNPDADCFIKIKDNFGYMYTGKMKEFLAENKDLGYKKLDILNGLKIMGVLHPNSSRAYDVSVRGSGNPRWFYKIELAEQAEDIQPDLVVE